MDGSSDRHPSRPKLRSRVAVASALVLSALAGAAPAAATHTSEHLVPAFGVGALRGEFFADYPLGLDDLGRMGQARIGLYRARLRQDQVAADGGFSNWSRLDNLARAAALNGVALQPVLIKRRGPGDAERERIRGGAPRAPGPGAPWRFGGAFSVP